MPPEPEPSQQPVQSAKGRAGSVVREVLKSAEVGRNEPCPCGSTLKYKRCCGNPLHRNSTHFDTTSSMESTACETK
ncbi:MAG: SEC-C domain-containing protein [Bryobacterales bacterium]|nr:SEC-C domain-containing protein [Bryobacterales bacterium]